MSCSDVFYNRMDISEQPFNKFCEREFMCPAVKYLEGPLNLLEVSQRNQHRPQQQKDKCQTGALVDQCLGLLRFDTRQLQVAL